ncbi:MAG TPA: hypothetical protein VHO24_06880 [Opitutaceae bacterium]|nr:hypothetical protein [Opitutaceae bacterium]
MSDLSTTSSPRPVSLFTVAAVFVGFALFLGVVYYFYTSNRKPADARDGVRSTAQRREMLVELRKKEAELTTKYGWVDQKAGVVRLPIERAMDLTVQQYGAKK